MRQLAIREQLHMYFKLQIGGHLGASEVFTVNVAYDVEGELTEGWVQSTANDMVAAAAAVVPPAALTGRLRPSDGIDSFRLEGRQDTDDALMGVAIANESYAGTREISVDDHPPQCAVVISLRTDSPGASGRGRIYWPCISATLESTLRLSTVDADAMAAGAAQYFSEIETAMEAVATSLPPWSDLAFAVRSTATKTTPHVVRLLVGNVVDTQRRRRDALPELTSVAQYPPV